MNLVIYMETVSRWLENVLMMIKTVIARANQFENQIDFYGKTNTIM